MNNKDYNYTEYWKGEEKFKKKEKYYERVYGTELNKGYRFPEGFKPMGLFYFLLLPFMALALLISDYLGWKDNE